MCGYQALLPRAVRADNAALLGLENGWFQNTRKTLLQIILFPSKIFSKLAPAKSSAAVDADGVPACPFLVVLGRHFDSVTAGRAPCSSNGKR